MELWLLVGALVLIGLTVWIVWTPQQSRDALITRPREEDIRMTNGIRSNLSPQGDAFEDQYTAATADLSAGGVATARESGSPYAGQGARAQPTYGGASSAPTVADEGMSQPWSAGGTASFDASAGQGGMPRTMGIGAGALMAVAGGVGGAWLYARWQRERNRPINRLRRGARDMASRVGERMPDAEHLPGPTGPVSGAAAALLVSSLVLSRMLRRGTDSAEARMDRSRDVVWDALGMGRQEAARRLRDADVQGMIETGRKAARGRWRDADAKGKLQKGRKQAERRMRKGDIGDTRRPAMLGGLGLGGTAVIAGAGYVIWRLLRGGGDGDQNSPNFYVGERSGE